MKNNSFILCIHFSENFYFHGYNLLCKENSYRLKGKLKSRGSDFRTDA